MKSNLKDLMSKRNPLSTQREAIIPANLYASTEPEKKLKQLSDQLSDLAPKHQSTNVLSNQSAKDTKQENTKAGKLQSDKVLKQQRTKPLKHFSSYLTGDSFKAIKQIGLDTNRKDYEVLQEAVDLYLKTKR